MVGDWKLENMAKKIFEGIWSEQERKDAVLEVPRPYSFAKKDKRNQALMYSSWACGTYGSVDHSQL